MNREHKKLDEHDRKTHTGHARLKEVQPSVVQSFEKQLLLARDSPFKFYQEVMGWA